MAKFRDKEIVRVVTDTNEVEVSNPIYEVDFEDSTGLLFYRISTRYSKDFFLDPVENTNTTEELRREYTNVIEVTAIADLLNPKAEEISYMRLLYGDEQIGLLLYIIEKLKIFEENQ